MNFGKGVGRVKAAIKDGETLRDSNRKMPSPPYGRRTKKIKMAAR